ncbi:MAG: hypothetical protein FWG10_07970, partial [Eubacteriaceae bacterium]|nr:hypothetical protein [Eubacteriaceae bacterium]
ETRQFRHRRALRCFRRLPAATPEPTAFQAVVVQLVASSPDKLFGVGMTSRSIEYNFDDMGMYFTDMDIFYIPIPNQGEGMVEIKLGV